MYRGVTTAPFGIKIREKEIGGLELEFCWFVRAGNYL
jgi:hypothetical protein